MGTRLRSIVESLPKGLIQIDGETLVGRSIRLLRDAGIEHITIVAGYAEDHFHRFAVSSPDVDVVVNNRYATTGSMASLAVALDKIQDDVLVLESDIVYEPRALTALMAWPAADATLLSGPTGAGDEVWVYAPEGRLQAMSKDLAELADVSGEFVGITRLSSAGSTAMLHAFRRFEDEHGHGQMDYETEALVAIARLVPVSAVLVPDLRWGEIDNERHFERVVREVWPALGDHRPLLGT